METNTIHPNEEIIWKTPPDKFISKSLELSIRLLKREQAEDVELTVNNNPVICPSGWIYVYSIWIGGTHIAQHSQYISYEDHNNQPPELKEAAKDSAKAVIKYLNKNIMKNIEELTKLING